MRSTKKRIRGWWIAIPDTDLFKFYMRRRLERIAPQDRDYAHNLRRGDGNGHSHVRASILGPSLTVPSVEGKPTLGTWQQIVFLDLDNRPRSRRIVVQIMSENARS